MLSLPRAKGSFLRQWGWRRRRPSTTRNKKPARIQTYRDGSRRCLFKAQLFAEQFIYLCGASCACGIPTTAPRKDISRIGAGARMRRPTCMSRRPPTAGMKRKSGHNFDCCAECAGGGSIRHVSYKLSFCASNPPGWIQTRSSNDSSAIGKTWSHAGLNRGPYGY